MHVHASIRKVVQARSHLRLIAHFTAAVAQQHKLEQAGKTLPAKRSKLKCATRSALGWQEAVPPAKLSDSSWKQFFAETVQCWDNRRSEGTPEHPGLRYNESKVPQWCLTDNQNKPGLQATSTGCGVAPGLTTFAATEGYLEIGVCRKLCDAGVVSDAVGALDVLVHRGCHVPSDLFCCALKKCIQSKDLALGRRIHGLAVKTGCEGDAPLGIHLIGLYALHGRLEEAMRVFTKLSSPDAHTWGTIISAYARHGGHAEAAEAVRLYRQMCESSAVGPYDGRLYSAVLKACAAAHDLRTGKEVHARVIMSSGKPDRFVQAGLVNMYAKCGSLVDARRLFDTLSDKDLVTWTAMIAGYAHQANGEEALNLHRSMQRDGLVPDSVTYVCLLQACASLGVAALHEGKQLHVQIARRGLGEDGILGGSLVNMYAKCGSLEDARTLFENLEEKNVVAWNAMIAGYAQQGMGHEALSLYSTMQQEDLTTPDSVTYVCLLQACASLGVRALREGKQLHVKIEERGLMEDPVVGGSLVNMYAKCGSLEDTRRVFDNLSDRNIVAWNAMIAGYSQHGMGQKALSLYSCVQQEGLTPSAVSYLCLLQACASVGGGALQEGKQLHVQIEELGMEVDAVLGGALVHMYANCGSLGDAREVFDKLSSKSVVAWTALIGGYAQHGMSEQALSLYSSMRQDGLTPDSATYVCLLQACAAVSALPLGEQLHAEIRARGVQIEGIVGAALVNMYAKCGSMYDSQRVFDSLSDRSIEAWGALVSGYAHQGDCQVVFDLVDMMRLEGIQPNEITFLSVLTVCSHVGLVEKGQLYFKAMKTDYGISATMEHYICMVDLFGRAGHLQEALQTAEDMPFPPSDAVWHTLLGACLKWKNVEIGQQAFKGAISLDEKDTAAYVLMYNIYASTQMWEAARKMKARRMNLGALKKPGQSWWTDMDGVVHTFSVGDRKHSESDGIYCRLEQLIPKLEMQGCTPQLQSSLLDLSDKKRQQSFVAQ